MQRKTRARAKHTANLASEGSSREELRCLLGFHQSLMPKGVPKMVTTCLWNGNVESPRHTLLTLCPEEQMVAMGWPDPLTCSRLSSFRG